MSKMFRLPDEAALRDLEARLKAKGEVRRNLIDDAGRKAPEAPKRSKYGNKRVVIDGITFDSQAEGDRWVQLRALEASGSISNLRRQVRYELAPAVKVQGRKRPPIRYIADFEYEKDGKTVTEDKKGFKTEIYKLKRHLMMAVHGIEVLES